MNRNILVKSKKILVVILVIEKASYFKDVDGRSWHITVSILSCLYSS